MNDSRVFPSSLPAVPLGTPTVDSIEAEIAAMGDTLTPVAPADLVADGREMLAARADIAELVARGYPVSEGIITRLELLIDAVESSGANRSLDRAELTPAQRDAMDSARRRLLAIRSELSAIASAGGLPPDLFALATKRSNRLNVVLMRVGQVIRHAEQLADRMPDGDRVQALIIEAKGLLEAQYTLRADAGLKRASQAGDTQRQERLERLLLDTLVYLSRQGRAAFASDPARLTKYDLDHVYGARPSRVGDPGAGGTTGFSDANPDAEAPAAAATA